jgi:predicted dehydrogenase
MIEVCRNAGARLSVAYYRHCYPLVARLKDIIASGEIGRVILAEVQAFESFRPASSGPRGWLTRKEQAGGGPLMDFGCHRIEVLLDLFGPVSKVRGSNARLVADWEVEDSSFAMLEFENRARGLLAVSRAVEEPRDALDVYGSAGSIHVPVLNRGALTVWTARGGRREDHPPHENVHLPYIQAVTEAFLEDREPPVPGETGLRVAEITEEIYGS